MSRRLLLLFMGVAAGVSGCTVGPDYKAPSPAMPAAFDTGLPQTAPLTQEMEIGQWWRRLNDPLLDSLMDRAIAANLDLKLAASRLAEARGQRDIAAAGLLPQARTSAAIGRGTSNNVTRDGIGSPLNTAVDTRGVDQVTRAAGLDFTWEIDLFGRVRRQIEAGNAAIEAAAEDRRGVLVTVLADVARAYAEMRSLQRRLEIAQRNTDSYKRVMEVVRSRNRNGLSTMLDVGLAERQYQASESLLAPLAADISETQRRLAVLLGLSPQEIYQELSAPGALPAPPPKLAVGLPSDLLRRRPDIRAAERQLAAANARVGVATADFFPQVTLSGALGYQAQGEGITAFDPRFIYSIGPGVRWPILDFGKLDATVHVQEARSEQAVINYKKAVLTAVLEVDNALARYTAERSRFEHLQQAAETADRVAQLAVQRFERGLTDMLNLLDAQRQQYAILDQLAVSEQAMLVQWVALNKALGGGWEGVELPDVPHEPPAISPIQRIVANPHRDAPSE